jgi:cold shock protein
MAEGIISKLMTKGYGFIKREDGKDLFFHSSAVQGVTFNDIHLGQKVSYTEGLGAKGPCAENVKLI